MTLHTTPDAAAISTSAADIIHQDAPTLDNSRSFSASTAAENRRRRKSTTSSAVKQRYNQAAYDLIRINISKGGKQAIQDAAAAAGLSMTAYITAAINAYAGREIVPPLATNPYI